LRLRRGRSLSGRIGGLRMLFWRALGCNDRELKVYFPVQINRNAGMVVLVSLFLISWVLMYW
jgi:hypothetical protein